MKKIEPKLTIEIIPSKSWYNNVRSNVSEKEWDIIRKKCYKEAGYKCEICGDNGLNQGQQHRVECHEIWNYDNKTKIQKLVGFISLCPLCHKVKHFGLAQISGDDEIAFHQLMKVNNMTEEEAYEYLNEDNGRTYRERFEWKLDISYVKEYIDDSSTFFNTIDSLF